MGDRHRAGKPLHYFTELPGQLSLLSTAGRKMSTGRSAVMLCGWGIQTWLIPHADKRVGVSSKIL